jgi:hypothetical protein
VYDVVRRDLAATEADLADRFVLDPELDARSALPPALAYVADLYGEVSVCSFRGREGTSAQFFIPHEGDLAVRIRELATQVQDTVIEHLGRAWPKCPWHAHPLTADSIDGVAVWVCDTAGRSVSRIGEHHEG